MKKNILLEDPLSHPGSDESEHTLNLHIMRSIKSWQVLKESDRSLTSMQTVTCPISSASTKMAYPGGIRGLETPLYFWREREEGVSVNR